jgi:hypothetical protein
MGNEKANLRTKKKGKDYLMVGRLDPQDFGWMKNSHPCPK